MRILHTSDWHLGRSLFGADLADAQRAFLSHLEEVVRSERVDVVVVAGDIYDRAIPPVDAVAMLEQGLADIRRAGAQIVAISGNHDSPARLGFGASLMTAGGVHIRTDPSRVAEPVEIDGAAFYCLPYLDPDAVRSRLPADPAGSGDDVGRSHAAVAARAMACVRAHAAMRGPSHVVVLAHGWVAGGEPSESERDISLGVSSVEIGGVGVVPTTTFDGADYVALGHLHGQQALDHHLRYSGSPLAYSFSEANHRKGSWLVDLAKSGPAAVEPVLAPTTRPLAVVKGCVDDLLRSREFDGVETSFLSVVATDPTRPVEPMERLRNRFPHVLTFRWEPPAVAGDDRSYAERVRGRSDLELALDFVAHVRSPAESAEQELLSAALAAGRRVDENAA